MIKDERSHPAKHQVLITLLITIIRVQVVGVIMYAVPVSLEMQNATIVVNWVIYKKYVVQQLE